MKTSYTNLSVERHQHTVQVTLHNPPAHTWTEDSLAALTELVNDVQQDRQIYALVISGDGQKFFSAGADLKVFADGDKATARRMAQRFGEAFEALAAFRGVTIAAINGYAMGGGLECALACDIRIAEAHAQMALPEASVGLLPCAGGTQNLARLVGEGWAKRMILCGERIDAAQAQAIGLVEEVVPSGEGLARAMALAAKVARQSPSSVAACKTLIQAGRTMPTQHVLPLERERFVSLFDTEDQKEGVQAFLSKREASWRNA
ncbi:MAG TPA: enoyl-CoA hydratase [Burkholderiaceae bacterium]|nr:enoyl-CoA hydratase [Burkholderiaceae bacterium]